MNRHGGDDMKSEVSGTSRRPLGPSVTSPARSGWEKLRRRVGAGPWATMLTRTNCQLGQGAAVQRLASEVI